VGTKPYLIFGTQDWRRKVRWASLRQAHDIGGLLCVMSQYHDGPAQQHYLASEIAVEMQHEELEPFISGPLEVPAVSTKNTLPFSLSPHVS